MLRKKGMIKKENVTVLQDKLREHDTKLDLDNIVITPELVVEITDFLKNKEQVEKLSLYNVRFKEDKYEEHENWFHKEGLTILGSLPFITQLDLGGCMLTEDSIQALCKNASPSIQRLYLCSNSIENITPLIAFTNIEVLDLRSNKLDGHAIDVLFNFSTLSNLYLAGNKFNPEEVTQLITLRLIELDIGKYEFTEQNISALLTNTTLQRLIYCKDPRILAVLERNRALASHDKLLSHFENNRDNNYFSTLPTNLKDRIASIAIFNEPVPERSLETGLTQAGVLASARYLAKTSPIERNKAFDNYKYFAGIVENPSDNNLLSNLPPELRKEITPYVVANNPIVQNPVVVKMTNSEISACKMHFFNRAVQGIKEAEKVNTEVKNTTAQI